MQDFKKTQPFISVVTPFYNTAEWLPECIESVLNQSVDNFEYILLDNCSTDGGGQIAERYANFDSRIRYIRNSSFLPQMKNFNVGLSLISRHSEYTKIVNADDVLYPSCLKEMTRIGRAYPKVGIVSNIALRGSSLIEASKAFSDWPFASEVINGYLAARYQLLNGVRFPASPTTVLYRSSIVRELRPFFEESDLYGSDYRTCFSILRDWDFGYVAQALTFLRTREEGVSSGIVEMDPFCHLLDELVLMRKYGPVFLDNSEFEHCWNDIRRVYMEHLARNFLLNHNPRFWQFHESAWRAINCPVSKWLLIWNAGLLGLRILSDPERVRRSVVQWRKTHGKNSRSSRPLDVKTSGGLRRP